MLEFPIKGVARPTPTHYNVNLEIFCDWLEGSLLFSTHTISQREIVDILCEYQISDSQDDAAGIVDDAWANLRHRQKCMGIGCPYIFTDQLIKLEQKPFIDTTAHTFFIVLSLSQIYKEWHKSFGHDYTEQGTLFENVLKESLEAHLLGWKVFQTGWSSDRTLKIADVVNNVSELLNEPIGDVRTFATKDANEAGLDILCYKPFIDNRPGKIALFMQCASGKYWDDKVSTPNMSIWNQLIHFTARELCIKAFATPFSLENDLFTRSCCATQGLLMDRNRILSASHSNPTWLSPKLSKQIAAWSRKRVITLPVM